MTKKKKYSLQFSCGGNLALMDEYKEADGAMCLWSILVHNCGFGAICFPFPCFTLNVIISDETIWNRGRDDGKELGKYQPHFLLIWDLLK